MMQNLRPRQAAQALGIALSTFWLKAKTDPDFPPLIRLGGKATVVRESDLEVYLQKKAQARSAVACRPATNSAETAKPVKVEGN